MSETVLFPDATAVVVSALQAVLAVPVRAKPPDPRPDEFVVVFRTGGERLNIAVDNPQLTVEAWALTDEAAHDLAQLARGKFHALRGTVVDGVAVYGTGELGGPVALPDPESIQPRYTFTATVALRGAIEST